MNPRTCTQALVLGLAASLGGASTGCSPEGWRVFDASMHLVEAAVVVGAIASEAAAAANANPPTPPEPPRHALSAETALALVAPLYAGTARCDCNGEAVVCGTFEDVEILEIRSNTREACAQIARTFVLDRNRLEDYPACAALRAPDEGRAVVEQRFERVNGAWQLAAWHASAEDGP